MIFHKTYLEQFQISNVKATLPAVMIMAAVLIAGSIYSVEAQVDMFLKIDSIEGESTHSKHAKSIDIESWSWGASHSGSTHVGGGGGAGKVTFSDVSLTKFIDKSTPKLLEAVATGKHFSKADLSAVKSGGGATAGATFLKIEMNDVIVTSISMAGSNDIPSEDISLNFAKFKFEYFPQKSDGSLEPGIPFAWDIAANKAG